jgi:hypothetical protein
VACLVVWVRRPPDLPVSESVPAPERTEALPA